MTFLSEQTARVAAGLQGSVRLAESELRKSAATSFSTEFDVFLSHSRLDAEVIVGVKNLLEREGLSVYVDWIEDPQLDRSHVTANTARVLRGRMRHSRSLIFATSDASPSSKWMPWELGYFDGFRNGHVAILPLVKSGESGFSGQEYLGLYPYIEQVSFTDRPPGFGIFTTSTRDRAAPLDVFVTQGVTL